MIRLVTAVGNLLWAIEQKLFLNLPWNSLRIHLEILAQETVKGNIYSLIPVPHWSRVPCTSMFVHAMLQNA